MPMFELLINDHTERVEGDAAMPLLWAVRDSLGLTGTKYGCGRALCGACTVLLDGEPARACSVPLDAVAGRRITTIEHAAGPQGGRVARAVLAAWARHEVAQCGYCQPGQVMSAIGLLTQQPHPDDDDIDAAMDGNLCRCATYARIRAAIHAAAQDLRRER